MAGKKDRKKRQRETAARKRAEHRDAVRTAHRKIDELTSDVLLRLAGDGIEPTCRAQCAGCCHQEIPVMRAEAEVVAEHVERTLTDPQREMLADRIRSYLTWVRQELPALGADGVAIEDAFLDHGPACPLLVDELCSAYAARPHTCRTHFATSEVGKCAPRSSPEFVDGQPDLIDFGPRKQEATKPIWRCIEGERAQIASTHRLPEWLAHLLKIEAEPWRSTPPTAFAEAAVELLDRRSAND